MRAETHAQSTIAIARQLRRVFPAHPQFLLDLPEPVLNVLPLLASIWNELAIRQKPLLQQQKFDPVGEVGGRFHSSTDPIHNPGLWSI